MVCFDRSAVPGYKFFRYREAQASRSIAFFYRKVAVEKLGSRHRSQVRRRIAEYYLSFRIELYFQIVVGILNRIAYYVLENTVRTLLLT